MNNKRGLYFLSLALIILISVSLFLVPNVTAQSRTLLLNLQPNAYWIWPTPYVIFYSATFQKWQNQWSPAKLTDSPNGQRLYNWALSSPSVALSYSLPHYNVTLGSSPNANETINNETFTEIFSQGYMAVYVCCNKQTGQCPNNTQQTISGGGSASGAWLCGWNMKQISTTS